MRMAGCFVFNTPFSLADPSAAARDSPENVLEPNWSYMMPTRVRAWGGRSLTLAHIATRSRHVNRKCSSQPTFFIWYTDLSSRGLQGFSSLPVKNSLTARKLQKATLTLRTAVCLSFDLVAALPASSAAIMSSSATLSENGSVGWSGHTTTSLDDRLNSRSTLTKRLLPSRTANEVGSTPATSLFDSACSTTGATWPTVVVSI